MTDQQTQTRAYFESAAQAWQKKAEDADAAFNIISGRNDAVLATLDELPKALSFLDIGCGTGQLVIDAARRGIKSTGIDFAKKMIEECEANRKAAGVEATFIADSFFSMPVSDSSCDAISGQGLIEYFSLDELDVLFERCWRMLKSGGAFLVGSRNRLFNVVSLNAFTQVDIDLGVFDRLVQEAIALHECVDQKSAIEVIQRYERIDPQPSKHPSGAIQVDQRFQFSPADLAGRLRQFGFVPAKIYPVHFHGLPTNLKSQFPALHKEIADLIARLAPYDPRLTPYCSTFVLDVRKP